MILSIHNYLKLFVIGGIVGIFFSLAFSPSAESMAEQNIAFIEEENHFGDNEGTVVAYYAPEQSINEQKDSNNNLADSTITKNESDKDDVSLLEILNDGEKQTLSNLNVTVKSGDTLDKILKNQGFSKNESFEAITALRKVFNPRGIKVGQEIAFAKSTNITTNESTLESITIEPRIGQRFSVRRDENRKFMPFEEKDTLTTKLYAAEGVIDSSLLSAALSQDVPKNIAQMAINVFSQTVDFRRDLRKGDKFIIMYEMKTTPDGRVAQNGSLVFASLNLRGHDLSVYRYTDDTGFSDYYDSKGRSLKKSLSKHPVPSTRITSPFGMRHHPITRKRVMHWGTDFAASLGTPVKASGDGVVVKRKYNGAYGNYVEIRHNSEYSTAYGHLSRYVKDVNVGTRVKQGQIIAYSGNTGRSTGPHLHFEVHKNGRRVNPMTVNAPAGRILEGKDLENFNLARKEIDTQYASLASDFKTALKN
ncbi:MAG: peptidoglycan DD-metalloendopeptidase family protein [Alphaproteobacteria bacterium]